MTAKPAWVVQLEAKHGRPITEIEGTVYVLCFDERRAIASVSRDCACKPDPAGGLRSLPVRHYVGWTQQSDPRRRISRHGAGSTAAIVLQQSGTVRDEQALKRRGTCPRCGGTLSLGG